MGGNGDGLAGFDLFRFQAPSLPECVSCSFVSPQGNLSNLTDSSFNSSFCNKRVDIAVFPVGFFRVCQEADCFAADKLGSGIARSTKKNCSFARRY